MSDGGKGSAPRPFSVSNEEYAKRWDAIFARDLLGEEGSTEMRQKQSSQQTLTESNKDKTRN